MLRHAGVVECQKLQITMTNPPPADQTPFGDLILEFGICLLFGAWSLGLHRLHYVKAALWSWRGVKQYQPSGGGCAVFSSLMKLAKDIEEK
jgi:hypothetical protein